jgi:hypothetical protein
VVPFRRAESHEPFRLYACLRPFQGEKAAGGNRGVGSDLRPLKTAET